MLDRDACERRVYRLAVLLTGNPISATKVIERVVKAKADLRQLDNAHMDRLTVLRSREIKPATLVDEVVPHQLATAIAKLTHQQREAWILSHVYQLTERELARAMDCSVTAVNRHLEQAKVEINTRLGEGRDEAAKLLLEYSMTLDVPEFFREDRQRKKHRQLIMMLVVAIVIVSLIFAGIIWLASITGQPAS